MKEKKSAVITFRTEERIKEKLEEIAEQNRWSLAQTVEQLCKNFIANPEPNTIYVNAKELIKMAKDIEKENCGGAEVTIYFYWRDEEKQYKKTLIIDGIECGGAGRIALDDSADELTEEEIFNIP